MKSAGAIERTVPKIAMTNVILQAFDDFMRKYFENNFIFKMIKDFYECSLLCHINKLSLFIGIISANIKSDS